MNLLLEPKHIDKAWKVTIWIYLIDGVVKFPLRFFRSYFSLETIDIFSTIRFLMFLLAIFLTSILYVKSTKKLIDKSLRFKVSLYVATITLISWLFFSAIFGELFPSMFGELLDGILSIMITSLACYFILPIGNKFMTKK